MLVKILLIILCILLFIIGIVLLLLFGNFKLKIVYDDELEVKAGIIFPIIPINSKTLSLFTKKKKTGKTAKSESEKKPKKKSSSDKIKEQVKTEGFTNIVTTVSKFISPSIEALSDFGERVQIVPFKMKFIMAGEDAAKLAIHYGMFSAFFWPILGFLDNKLKRIKKDILLDVDYVGEKSVFYLNTTIKFKSVFLLINFIKVLIKSGFIKI